MRFAIRRSDNQLTDGLSGAPIGTSQNPLIFPRTNTKVEWQVAEDYGGGTYQMPILLPTGTAWTFAFKRVGEFEGDTIIAIVGDEVTEPTTGDGVGYLINSADGFATGETVLVVDGGSGTILAGDVVTIGVHAYTVASDLSSTVLRIAAPGLLDDLTDNAPVNITGSAGYYTATMYGNSAAAQADLLTPNANATDDIASESLATELTYKLPDAAPEDDPNMSQTVFATLTNVYFNSGDPSPSLQKGTPVQFLRTIDDYIGGAANQLDSVATLVYPVPSLVFIVHSSGVIKQYELVAGTDPESSPTVIRPDDYATTTNEKVWKLKPGGGDAVIADGFAQFAAGPLDATVVTVSTINGLSLTDNSGVGTATFSFGLNSSLTLGGSGSGAVVDFDGNAFSFQGGGTLNLATFTLTVPMSGTLAAGAFQTGITITDGAGTFVNGIRTA